ncbi:unnamed protein product [Staurois parvus]|uniref:Uncharacterized protein n=1 Tax=Staurois parvus TaxID=386267 RepID=A0ABN9BUZ4_9NEOB|nr:unnamed protein product [Staurois parvus]
MNVTFCHFQISRRSVPVRPDVAGDGTQKTDAGICWRTLQGTLQEGHHGAQDKVREEQIPEQRRMVSPSVARG